VIDSVKGGAMNFKKDITCPKCGHIHEEQFELTIKGKKTETKSTPLNPSIPSDGIRSVVNHYLATKGIKDQTAVKMQYPRLAKTAKEYLMKTGGDVKLINSKITNADKYFKGNGLSWVLETVGKCWSQIEDGTTSDYKGW